MFGDPSFSGVAATRSPAPVERANVESDRAHFVTHSPECFTRRDPSGCGLPLSEKSRRRAPRKKPVADGKRRRSSRKEREAAAAKQAKHRAVKREKGLQLLELWVPGAVKAACRSAAKREKTTMDLKGGAVLAAAFGLLPQAPGKGTP